MSFLIYLHGFNSSPQSEKACLTQAFFSGLPKQKKPPKVIVPALPSSPLKAIAHVKGLVEELGREELMGFVGSSLGGYYSLYLQHYYSTLTTSHTDKIPKVVLINPAVKPYELLEAYIGENKNIYTGEVYTVEPYHMDDLKSLQVKPIASPLSTYLLTQTGDEVLAFHEAVDLLRGAKMWISSGGSHAFEGFSAALPSIESFLLDA